MSFPDLLFTQAIALAYAELGRLQALAEVGMLAAFTSDTPSAPRIPTTQELDNYPVIRGSRLLFSGGRQAIFWNRTNSSWVDVSPPGASGGEAPVLMRAFNTSAQPILLNSWVNYGVSTSGPSSYSIQGSTARLHGMVGGGALNTRIVLLPAVACPAYDLRRIVATSSGAGVLRIQADGGVYLESGGTTWVDLGVTWLAG